MEEDEFGDTVMKFGDSRGDVHPAVTVMHTVFHRLHNDLAVRLSEVNPHWNDEKLYQEARKIVGALFQHVVYSQFMDAMLGPGNFVSVPKDELDLHFYEPDVDGTIDLVFSTAAYRFAFLWF